MPASLQEEIILQGTETFKQMVNNLKHCQIEINKHLNWKNVDNEKSAWTNLKTEAKYRKVWSIKLKEKK